MWICNLNMKLWTEYDLSRLLREPTLSNHQMPPNNANSSIFKLKFILMMFVDFKCMLANGKNKLVTMIKIFLLNKQQK